MAKLDVNIIQIPFPNTQYYKEEIGKKQIVLHHTASGRGVDGDFRHWLSNTERVATCVIIDADGIVHQCFNSKYWGHHLGITFAGNKIPLNYKTTQNNIKLNKESIAVEIDAWGGLTNKNGKWLSYTGKEVPKENVIEYPTGFRGYYGFERYTDKQIETVKKLLIYWNEIYKIPLSYNQDMWNVNEKALSGNSGIWTHASYRSDKSDCHPQENLVSMLKSLVSIS